MNKKQFKEIKPALKNNGAHYFLMDIISLAEQAKELLNSEEYKGFLNAETEEQAITNAKEFDKKYIKFVEHVYFDMNPCDTSGTEWEDRYGEGYEISHIETLRAYYNSIENIYCCIEENYTDQIADYEDEETEFKPEKYFVSWANFYPSDYYDVMEDLGLFDVAVNPYR
jgi:hypothetical protein